uniref:Uncharacterized protein n=1 Tax=Quercus lobata TaxID=97700 RepID=A0A7N2LWB9_QUELO
MLGMMDTVLNLGLNDEVVGRLASKSGERFANDSYKRFLGMVVDVVTRGEQYNNFFLETKGENFPSDPCFGTKQQLQLAIKAVFDSWDSPRANKFRNIK